MVERRVVVTGMGCISPLGNSVAETWCRMKRGESGVGPITQFDASRLPSRIAGECREFDPTTVLDARKLRHMDRFQHLAYASAIEALEQAQLEITPANADRVGIVMGSGIGGIKTIIDGCALLFERGPGRVSPFFITKMAIDLAPGSMAILLDGEAGEHDARCDNRDAGTNQG